MLIRPDNLYTRRFDRLSRRLPLLAFAVLGGGILLAAVLAPLFNGGETAWPAIIVVEVTLALLCGLLSLMLSRRGFSRLLAKIGTQLTPGSIIFDNPYFGGVELAWEEITDIKLVETKGQEGVYFKLDETRPSFKEIEPLLLRGREREKANGYHWRMTPDLYDRPPAEMYALLAHYWRNPAERSKLEAEPSKELTR